jgi:hypothetical protein
MTKKPAAQDSAQYNKKIFQVKQKGEYATIKRHGAVFALPLLAPLVRQPATM